SRTEQLPHKRRWRSCWPGKQFQCPVALDGLGPEPARVIEEFKDEHQYWSRQRDTHHHDQIPCVAIGELSNPFEEESLNLVALHTKEILRDGNLEEFLRHENQACPPALSDGDSIRLCKKGDLLACLGDLYVAQAEAPPATSVGLDGAAVPLMLKPAAAKNFEEYAQEVFIPYMSTKLQTASRLDLVFDRYVAESLKCTARAKRGQGIRKRVVGSATIPGNWQNFLRVDSNKTELFKFLSDTLLTWFDKEDKQLVITDGQAVLSKPVLLDLASIAPSNHEEAHSRMLLHASHAAQHGHHKILIRTVDTDVVVLAVSVVQGMHQEDGTGTSFRYLSAHEMAACLGPKKARALPLFHVLTGCDSVSRFSGHGKKTD
ncbi:hypothetical protein Hamer_G010051, partial [Homarus americanus]